MEPNRDAGATDVSSAAPFLLFSLIGGAHHSLWKRIKNFFARQRIYLYKSSKNYYSKIVISSGLHTEHLHVEQNFQDNSRFLRRVLKGKF